jgi:hypothetical protein
MARKNTPLDYRVESAIIQVCEDLTLDIDTVAQEICDEFEGSETPASLSAIVSDLRSARLVQIIENDHEDYVDRAESAFYDRLYVEAP